jgi:hypothetical protein
MGEKKRREQLKVEIISDPRTQAKTADVVVCHRVEDMPIPRMEGCVIERCRECESRVWVAPTSPMGIMRLCYVCATPHFAQSDKLELLITERTLFGAGPETANAIEKLMKAIRSA